MQDVTIMSARRSYEYSVDDIRLTLLSNAGIVQHLQQSFAFQAAGAGQPAPTFGIVPNSFPPGLVFDFGLTPFPEGQATALRFIHIEQTRIVIDVAGPSDVIDPTFTMLNGLVGDLSGPDGAPALGSPTHTLDFSEIRLKLPFAINDVFAGAGFDAISDALAGVREQAGRILVPVVEVRLADPASEYQGSATPGHQTFVLDLRAGTKPSDGICYSGAPLDSAAHLELLGRLEGLMAERLP